jgi:hypothetical protein
MTDFDEMKQQLSLLPDEELVSILKKHDEEEWRPEVFDIVKNILRERGISPDLSFDEDVAETAPLDLVTVGQYTNYMDAEADRVALEAQGVDGWILNKYAPSTTVIQLQVRSGDEYRAMGILAPEPGLPSDFPEETAKPPCPECGSKDVSEEAETSILSKPADSTSDYAWFYLCNSCGYRWAQPE